MPTYESPQKTALAPQPTLQAARTAAPPAFQLKAAHGQKSSMESITPVKDSSARFKGDNSLTGIFDGTETLKKGDKGINVVKLQQALLDMGYTLPKYGVDGDFGDETVTALKQFQHDKGLTESGDLDKATIEAMDTRFDDRSDYLRAADDFDPANPTKGTRTLPADQKTAAKEALKPQKSAPGATFTPDKGGKKYGDEIKARLTTEIARLHKELYADKVGLRADPGKNFHKNSNLEGAANAGKDATDKVYGDLNKGPAFAMGTNLIDQWADEERLNTGKSDTWKKNKARGKVEYLVDANCADINIDFNASPSDTEEKKILDPIIETFIDDTTEVEKILQIDMGWPGAQLDGTQYLQLYKDPDAETNRLRLWTLFHVSIHEYIHTLAHTKYRDWASALGGSQEHTLMEGFCDFFTLNVRAKHGNASLKTYQKQVEGDFHDPAKDVPDTSSLDVGVYDSNAEAERMVGIIGINNAQLGYFRGRTDLMGQ